VSERGREGPEEQEGRESGQERPSRARLTFLKGTGITRTIMSPSAIAPSAATS